MANQYDNFALGIAKNETLDKINGAFSADKVEGIPVGHMHDPNSPGNGGEIMAEYIANTPAGDVASVNVQNAINELNVLANLGRIHVPVRQTVLHGSTDQSIGQANFLQVGTGLAIDLTAAATPLIMTFAYNFDSNFGALDYIGKITDNIIAAWSNLPANQAAIYLYIDRNISTGVLTYGYSLLEPIYKTLAPGSPSTDQHWFDLNSFYMKRWTGAAWEIKQRVFVGECVTTVNSVTNLRTYALQGRYDSGWFAVANSSAITKNHNIGVRITDGLQLQFYFSLDANGADASFAHDVYYQGPDYSGHLINATNQNNTRSIIRIYFGSKVQYYSGLRDSGYYRIFMKRGW